MPQPPSFGRLGVEVTARMPSAQGVPQRDLPLRVGILGDFSARANRPWSPPPPKLAGRNPVRVDRDNLDEVLQKAAVELQLPAAGPDSPAVRLRIAELDDFEPDRLVQRVEVFEALRGLRRRLSNPSTFAAAAAEMAGPAPAGPSASPPPSGAPATPKAPAPPPASPGNVLEQILAGLAESPQPREETAASARWQALIRQVAGPHVVRAADSAQQAELVARVDEAAGRHMRAILHHPDFQAVEAAWRAVHFLVRRVETDARLQLFLLDVSRAELAADLASADDLRSTGVYRLLVEEAAAQPWGILAGLYTFDQSRDDVELLGRLARIAGQAGAPFLAGAGCRLLGCASLAETPHPDDWHLAVGPGEEEAWAALRRLPEAPYLGLALPRFLLRLPYGKDTAPTEQLHFQEMPEGSRHEEYLWGHPAAVCVCLMAQAFRQSGWAFRPGTLDEVDGLPVHVYREAGEGRVKPCAEVVLVERAVERMVGKGLMPLLSFPGRDAVCVAGFRSLADPPAPLAGRWR
jgi:type VI secretion system protein ImpC